MFSLDVMHMNYSHLGTASASSSACSLVKERLAQATIAPARHRAGLPQWQADRSIRRLARPSRRERLWDNVDDTVSNSTPEPTPEARQWRPQQEQRRRAGRLGGDRLWDNGPSLPMQDAFDPLQDAVGTPAAPDSLPAAGNLSQQRAPDSAVESLDTFSESAYQMLGGRQLDQGPYVNTRPDTSASPSGMPTTAEPSGSAASESVPSSDMMAPTGAVEATAGTAAAASTGQQPEPDPAWPRMGTSDTWDEAVGDSSAWYEAGWGQSEPVYDWGGEPPPPGPGVSSPAAEDGQAAQGPPGGRQAWATHSRFEGAGAAGSYTDGAAAAGPGPGGRQGAEFFADAGPSGGFDPAAMPSDITLLSRPDVESVLPLAPTGKQVDFYQPRTIQERIVQVLGSLGASMMLSKVVVLAGPALLYPVWSPWIRAGLRNLELYTKQYKCVGLWRAQVLEVEASAWQFGGSAGGAMVRLLVGDAWPGGARVQLEFPYQAQADRIRVGELAEMLVLCKDDAFVTFKVVRELYLPESGLWLAEYPFVDRNLFLDISLSIERARQAQAQQAQQPWQEGWATGMPPDTLS